MVLVKLQKPLATYQTRRQCHNEASSNPLSARGGRACMPRANAGRVQRTGRCRAGEPRAHIGIPRRYAPKLFVFRKRSEVKAPEN